MNIKRNAPRLALAPAPHLVNDGKTGIMADVPAEYPDVRITHNFDHLKPRWT